MKIVWDEIKRQGNLAKHGMDFSALDPDILAAALVVPSHREGRFVAIGEFKRETIVAVVFRPL